MITYRVILVFSILFIGMKGIFSNQVYTIVHEKAELIDYNASLTTPDVVFSFRKINVTTFALNASFTLLEDILERNGNRIMVKLAVDKLFGSEYKRTGSYISIALCKLYEKNTFGMGALLKQYSNIDLCNVRKGNYHITNLIPPDGSMFPKFIPFGSYRLIITPCHEDGAVFFVLHWYARVEKVLKY